MNLALAAAAAGTVLITHGSSLAAVDTLATVVTKDQAVGGVTSPGTFSAYGYDADNQTYYTLGYNAAGMDIRQVTAAGSAPNRLLTQAAYMLWTKGGNADNGGGVPIPASLVLNPKDIIDPTTGQVVIKAYSTAIIADIATTVTTGSPAVKQNDLSQRVYRFDLYKLSGTDAISTPVSNANASSVLTSLVTTAQLATAGGGDPTLSPNTGRQVAFSSDGQSVYFADSSTTYGGLYRVNVLGGGLTKIGGDTNDNTEPTVVNVNGVDRVYLRGGTNAINSAGVKVTNTGGLDYFDTSDNSRHVAISAADLKSFFETTGDATTFSTTSDAAGNIYFNNNNNTTSNAGIYRLDPQGRIVKVLGYSERKAFATAQGFTGTLNVGTLREQIRSGTYNGFDIQQLTFADITSLNQVTAVNLFKTGDFNRDNTVNAADLQLFGNTLTVRGVKQTNADNLKFDLNGNDVVDYKDVKILQQFVNFSDGDANLDLKTDFSDLNVLSNNYLGTSKTWIQGDLNGDDKVDYSDLLIAAGAYTQANGLPTFQQLTDRYSGQFLADAETAFAVPEPASLAALAMGGLLLRRKRR